jgi:predicted RNase H-like HicB family nuclease
MRNILGSHFEESIFEPFCIECETYFSVDERTCSGDSEFCECPKCRYSCTCGKDTTLTIEEDSVFGYIPRMIYRNEDGIYVAYCPQLGESPCSFCGDTPEESLKGLDPVLEEVLAYLKEKEDSLITIDKEILIDSLCEEFGITEGKMRRAIDHAMKIKKDSND